MLDFATAKLTPVAADVRPHAWVDDQRVLGFTGKGQDKVLRVMRP
jgi:hypothetical protein